jgi:FAD/FMN-containing dehydrogenase
VTAAALKLFPSVRNSAHAACIVSDPEAAVTLLQRLRARFDTAIHAFELVSGGEVELALRYVEGLRAPFSPVPPWMVMIELGSSDSDAGLVEKLTGFLGRVLTDEIIEDAIIPTSGKQVNELWAVRHSLSEANKKAGHGIVFDVAVRISHVPEFIRDSARIVTEHTPLADPVFVCHLGDGNVHLIAMIPKDRVPPRDILDPLVDGLQEKVHDLAERLGGSFSAEHGIGRKLADEMARRLPAAEMRLMRAIKQAMDPDGLFAPGVLLSAEAIVEQTE